MHTTPLIIKGIDNKQSDLHLRLILTNGLNIYSIYIYKKVVKTSKVQQKLQGTRELNQVQAICLLPQPLDSFRGAEHFTEGSSDSCPYGLHIPSIIKYPSRCIHVFQLLMDPPQILVWTCLPEYIERCLVSPSCSSAKIKG